MKGKYWHKLLTEWRKMGRDGFSIPFIIGSQKYLPKNYIRQDIKTLLEDIANSSNDEIYILYCFTINDIILGIRDNTKVKIAGHFLPNKQNSKSNLFLTDGVKNLGTNIQSIVAELEGRYQSDIDAEKFSMKNRERGDYSDDEIAFIKACFAIYFE